MMWADSGEFWDDADAARQLREDDLIRETLKALDPQAGSAAAKRALLAFQYPAGDPHE